MAYGDLLWVGVKKGGRRRRQHSIELSDERVFIAAYNAVPIRTVVSSEYFRQVKKIHRVEISKECSDDQAMEDMCNRILEEKLPGVIDKIIASLDSLKGEFIMSDGDYPWNEIDFDYFWNEIDFDYLIMRYYRTGKISPFRGCLIYTNFIDTDKKLLRRLLKGSVFTHWGIYDGEGHVYHYDPQILKGRNLKDFIISGIPFEKTSLKSFKENLKGNIYLELIQGSHPEEVLRRADDLIRRPEKLVEEIRKGGNMTWDLLWRNCEHAAVWCKTGEWSSSQVRKVRRGAVRKILNMLPAPFSVAIDLGRIRFTGESFYDDGGSTNVDRLVEYISDKLDGKGLLNLILDKNKKKE